MTSTPFHAYYTARILESLQDDDKFIPAFASSDIKVYPYQVGAALFATRSPYSKGVVLMDESGLGKSTEAMLVVTQKWYESKNRILILVPNADLLKQWEVLIQSKYSVPFVTISNALQLESAGNTFEQDAAVLTTFDFAVQNSTLVEQIALDVTVFEEASLLSSVYKEDNKRARILKQITDPSFEVLLTGTPIEKNILDLYGLMWFIDSGKRLTNDDCLKILSMPVEDWNTADREKSAWLKTHKAGIMDRLIPLDGLIEQTVKDTSSALADEIERMKRKAAVDKTNLEHNLADIKTEIAELTKQKDNATGDRMQRLVLERKLGEATNRLRSLEESIYFDTMRIDLALEEDIKKFLENKKINARMLRHFEIEVEDIA